MKSCLNPYRLIENNKNIILSIFFIGFLFIGLGIFKDYGVHWDEYTNQNLGMRSVEYFTNLKFNDFSHSGDRDLIRGAVFESFLFFIEKRILKLTDSRDIIFMRHLSVFLVFYAGVFFFYLLCKSFFKSWKIGLLGCLFLVLHPRIFSHAFYNSIDILFLSLYTLSMYSLVKYLENKSLLRAGIHAIICSILIGIRQIGFIAPLCAFLFIVLDLSRVRKDKEKIKKAVKSALFYLLLLVAFTVLFSPVLWGDPVKGFFHMFKSAQYRTRLPSGWEHNFVWLGKSWYYNFKWILLTTPLLYSFYFGMGLIVSTIELFKKSIRPYYKRNVLLIIFLFFMPILLPLILKIGLFDEWRHHYFIYPCFVVFSLIGLSSLFEYIKLKFQGRSYKIINSAFILIIVFSLIDTIQFMIKYHPHQHIYANILAGKDMRRAKVNFALDYWGLSYRKALEYILKNDKSAIIKIYVANLPGKNNAGILPLNDRNRLVYVENPDEAKYFLSNYRMHKENYPYKDEYYSLKIGEIKYMVVYKLTGKERPWE